MSILYEPSAIGWIFDGAFIRKARKQHACDGGYENGKRVRCNKPILPRETYIEYLGNVGAYESGQHYHLDCAKQEGLLRDTPTGGSL